MATETTKPAQAKDAAKAEPHIEVKEEKVKEEPKAAEASKSAAKGPATTEEGSKAKEEPKAHESPKAREDISRVGRAEAIIRRHVLWSVGAGVVPVPILDLIAISGVQLKMLSELSELYGLSFSEDIAKKLIGSLFSSALGVGVGTALALSIGKIVPVLGSALGIVAVPVVAGAFTHATGRVFIMHFEAGGTLLDFDPHAMRSYFKQELERAKETVAKVAEEQKTKATKAS